MTPAHELETVFCFQDPNATQKPEPISYAASALILNARRVIAVAAAAPVAGVINERVVSQGRGRVGEGTCADMNPRGRRVGQKPRSG